MISHIFVYYFVWSTLENWQIILTDHKTQPLLVNKTCYNTNKGYDWQCKSSICQYRQHNGMSNFKRSHIPEHCGLFNALKNTFTQLSLQYSHNAKHYYFFINLTNIWKLPLVQQRQKYLNIQPTDCSAFTHNQASWSMQQFFRILLRFQGKVKAYTQITY